ncbi:hypothetical protein SALBM311S_05399 [Streptomyces alboniger]
MRPFAQTRSARRLRDQLDRIGRPDAPTTHKSPALVRALRRAGRRVLVVTDACEEAPTATWSGTVSRSPACTAAPSDPSLLTPHPDCLLRALSSPTLPLATGVLIGSTVAELSAARQMSSVSSDWPEPRGAEPA